MSEEVNAPLLIEAESDLNLAKVKRVADGAALGGIFVAIGTPYNPLFKMAASGTGESFTIWVRHRGEPVQLKCKMPGDEKQTERQWAWYNGPEFRWSSLGTYRRELLGEFFYIIRGPSKEANAGLDAVIISQDPFFRPSDEVAATAGR